MAGGLVTWGSDAARGRFLRPDPRAFLALHDAESPTPTKEAGPMAEPIPTNIPTHLSKSSQR